MKNSTTGEPLPRSLLLEDKILIPPRPTCQGFEINRLMRTHISLGPEDIYQPGLHFLLATPRVLAL
mgnify:CR=1 FL=1